jgi:hypothetical protein
MKRLLTFGNVWNAVVGIVLVMQLTACREEVVAPVPVHKISESKLWLDKKNTSRTVFIRNIGQAPLEWSITTNDSFVIANIKSGSVTAGDSVGIILSINQAQLPEEFVHLTKVTFHFPKTFDQIIPVTVVSLSEEKFLLNDKIRDAEYDRNHDLIIAVTKNSGKLLMIDPEKESIVGLQLDFPAVAVSVSPDGNYALVGHRAALSYVNLETLAVEKVIPLSFDVFDVILSKSGWGYVFPGNTQWTNLYCIKFGSGETSQAWRSCYSETRGRIQPGSDFIYSVSTRLFPPDLEKYNIENGQAEYLYDSRYHGDYPIGDNFWFSDNGQDILTSGGTIFSTDSLLENDLIYAGALSDPPFNYFYALEHSSAAGLVCAIPGTQFFEGNIPGSLVLTFDLSYHRLGAIALEQFVLTDELGNTGLYDGLGYFIFFNKAGTRVYVLEKANNPMKEVWAVNSFDVD